MPPLAGLLGRPVLPEPHGRGRIASRIGTGGGRPAPEGARPATHSEARKPRRQDVARSLEPRPPRARTASRRRARGSPAVRTSRGRPSRDRAAAPQQQDLRSPGRAARPISCVTSTTVVPRSPVHPPERLQELQAVARIEPGRGLVEQPDLGLLRERPREEDAAPLAARERGRVALGERFDVAGAHGLERARADPPAISATKPRPCGARPCSTRSRRADRKDEVHALRHVGDAPRGLAPRQRRERTPVEENLAARRTAARGRGPSGAWTCRSRSRPSTATTAPGRDRRRRDPRAPASAP